MKKVQCMCTGIYVVTMLVMIMAFSSTIDMFFYIKCALTAISALLFYGVTGKGIRYMKGIRTSQALFQVNIKDNQSMMYQEALEVLKQISTLQKEMLKDNSSLLQGVSNTIKMMDNQVTVLCESVDHRLEDQLQIRQNVLKRLEETAVEHMDQLQQLSGKNTKIYEEIVHALGSSIQGISDSVKQHYELTEKCLNDSSDLINEKSKEFDEKMEDIAKYVDIVIEDLGNMSKKFLDDFTEKIDDGSSNVAKDIKALQKCLESFKEQSVESNKKNAEIILTAYNKLEKAQDDLIKNVEKQQMKYQQLNEEEANILRGILV